MIRKAAFKDLATVDAIYQVARGYMKRTGNPHQWGDKDPSMDIIGEDLDRGCLHVVERDGRVEGVFALLEDGDPCYDYIEGDGWRVDGPYVAVHRVAADEGCHGIMGEIMDFVKKKGLPVRMDTHRDNLTMQHILEREGFSCRGVVHVMNGTERLAFELIVK